MSIATLIHPDHIFLDLEAKSRNEVINQLSDFFVKKDIVSNKEDYVKAVLDREVHSTTGIGNETAIPHGKSNAVKKASLVFARLNNPIDWESLDDQPVKIVILMAIPEAEKGTTHLRLLSDIAMKLMDDDTVDGLKTEINKEEIIKLLS